jgi:hypothetical protein
LCGSLQNLGSRGIRTESDCRKKEQEAENGSFHVRDYPTLQGLEVRRVVLIQKIALNVFARKSVFTNEGRVESATEWPVRAPTRSKEGEQQ